jgi:hypothetical protein
MLGKDNPTSIKITQSHLASVRVNKQSQPCRGNAQAVSVRRYSSGRTSAPQQLFLVTRSI